MACPFQAKGWAMWLGRRLWVSWFLEWRKLREAGFTEQRLPPAPGSGRITGRCLPVPIKTRWVHPKWTITFFVLGFAVNIQFFCSFLIWSGFSYVVNRYVRRNQKLEMVKELKMEKARFRLEVVREDPTRAPSTSNRSWTRSKLFSTSP